MLSLFMFLVALFGLTADPGGLGACGVKGWRVGVGERGAALLFPYVSQFCVVANSVPPPKSRCFEVTLLLAFPCPVSSYLI